MSLRLLHDWVLIELEPEKKMSSSGIILAGPQPVRTAKVLKTGPGRRDKKGRLTPTQVKPGDRFPFFKAADETMQGRALAEKLPENQSLIKESDILFVIEEGNPEVSV